MNRTTILTILTLLVAPQLVSIDQVEARGGGGATAVSDIPTAIVIDGCREYTDPDPSLAQNSEAILIDFLGRPPVEPVRELEFFASKLGVGAAAFASLPGYERTHLFVAEGSKLKVYDVEKTIRTSTEDWLFDYYGLFADPVPTFNIGTLVGLPDLELKQIANGRRTGFEAFPGAFFMQSALYLVGTRPGEQRAYYIVLDQQWLIEGMWPQGGTNLYGFGPICASPTNCTIVEALDLRVGDRGEYLAGYNEEAYINVVQRFGTTDVQIAFRLERGLEPTAFSLTPRTGSAWTSPVLVDDAAGIRFAENSNDVYVPLKLERRIRNAYDYTNSCKLSGEPTDVAVWEPGVTSHASRYLFVPTWDGSSVGQLEISPAGACVDPPDPLAANQKLEIAKGVTSIDIYPVRGNELWILAVSPSVQSFEAIRLQFQTTGGVDKFVELQRHKYDTRVEDPEYPGTYFWEGSCPSHVGFALRDLLVDSDGNPSGKVGLERKCAINDPRCPPRPRP